MHVSQVLEALREPGEVSLARSFPLFKQALELVHDMTVGIAGVP